MGTARHGKHASAPSKQQRTSVIEVLGELLLTAGVLLLLFGFYEAYWTNIAAGRNQQVVEQQLEHEWAQGENTNPPVGEQTPINRRRFHHAKLGEAFARIYIPAFGSDYQFAIVEGTNDDDLLKGPGRYVDSQMPGEPGNFAVAGHRVGKGAPFNDLGNLHPCDAIIIETRTNWEIYRVLPIDATGTQRQTQAAGCLAQKQVQEVTNGKYAAITGRSITVPGDYAVIYAVPGKTEAPTADDEALLTLTTCHPQFSNKQRMIIHAMLERTEPKTPGHRPKEMV